MYNNDGFFSEKITYKFNYQEKHFWRCRYTSTNSNSLHYKILLPLTVKPISMDPVPVYWDRYCPGSNHNI